MLVRLLRAVGDGGDLRHTDAGHHPGRADGAGADAHLDHIHARGNQIARGRGRRDVAGEQRDIRIAVPDRLHLLQHARAVAVGRVNIDHVRLGGQQRLNPFKHVVGHAHRRAAQQPAVGILGAVGIFLGFFDVLDRDQTPEIALRVHDGQLLDPVVRQNLLGLLQGRSLRRGDQVFAGHHLADLPAVICFKPEIPVGQNADQLSVPRNGNAADPIAGHQVFGILNQVVGAQEERVGNHAVLAALHLVHLGCLFLDAHVLVNDSEAALPGHGDGHVRVRHRIHGRADHRDVQPDLRGKLNGEIHVSGEHLAPGRHQQYVVKSVSFSDSSLQHLENQPPSDFN